MHLHLWQGCRDAVHPVKAIVKPIIAQFVIHPHSDERCARDPQCKAQDINEGKAFLAEKISNCDFNVVTEHMKAGLSA
jgi:hypothetical protein